MVRNIIIQNRLLINEKAKKYMVLEYCPLIMETTHREAVRADSGALRIDGGRIEAHVVGVIHIRVGTRRPVDTVVSGIVGESIGVIAVASRRELEGFGDAEVRLRRS
jgi:hypothetical protein